jgi:hypothetical protein
MSGNAYLFIIMIGMLISFVAVVTVMFKLYFRAKRKGYNSPLLIPGMIVPCFAGFFGGMILFFSNDELINTNSYTYDSALVGESLIDFALYFCGTFMVSLIITSLVISLLPEKSRRITGGRSIRFPWSLTGKCLLATGGLLIILAVWPGMGRDKRSEDRSSITASGRPVLPLDCETLESRQSGGSHKCRSQTASAVSPGVRARGRDVCNAKMG